MKLSFLTLFPQLIIPYFETSIMAKAIKNKIIKIECIDIRSFSIDKHKKVDSPLIGGGAGMLLEPYTLHLALQKVIDSRIIFLSPVGAKFKQNDAKRLSMYSHISLVCGRYEGFDERIIELYGCEIFSIGDFILSGGELAALCVVDSIIRNLDSVLGNIQSLQGESFEISSFRGDYKHNKYDEPQKLKPHQILLEAPNFTKSKHFDKNFKNLENLAPVSAFSKGNHTKISDLKLKMSRMKTQYFRPDLYRF